MPTTNEIRRLFLDYFRDAGHEVVSSSPLVPRNDPSLLFVNAGMVQFKNVFTGQESRDYSRAVTSQKCVRAGGKHNDLENVGYTARHHTFFEMLGNFSFGDYFKERAIELAWNLVTKEMGLDAECLLVTAYAEDEEAAALWRKIAGLPDQRIIPIATSDNFWAMGDTGPCGPCSEIFYDHGPHIQGGPPGSPDEDGDRFIEIWNLVFMQYEQVTKEERVDLPRPSIDTGMGLERIAAVLQGKHDNYDIDLMRGLIEASAEASGVAPEGPHGVSHRVIADHLRASSLLLADGVMPANEGRGYVLRRIMRRGMRHAHKLGAKEPLLYRLVPALVSAMGQAFPELQRAEPLIRETLKLEETRFRETLGRGLRLLEEATGKLGEGESLDGGTAFKLYDTYGFPLDLTQDILRGQGCSVDQAGFDAAMAKQKAAARAAWSGSGEAATDRVWFDLRERSGASEFLGYTTEMAEGVVQALVVEDAEVKRADKGQEVAVVVNQTPFYGEAGGQQGDSGLIFSSEGAEITVKDTQRRVGDLFVHLGQVNEGSLTLGETVELRVSGERRERLRGAHSATHLLHAALRRRLGDHVTQKGSLVAPGRLRFDISQPTPLIAEDLQVVEREVNARIRGNSPVVTTLMQPDEAVEAGAMALFGEKYGEEVRVLEMGGQDPENPAKAYSLELCGGTHVTNTGDIGYFKITGEGALAAGVRRIEAVTGEAAVEYAERQEQLLSEAAAALKAALADLPGRVGQLLEERRKLEREVADLRRKLAVGGSAAPAEQRAVAGVSFIAKLLPAMPARDLKPLADELKRQVGSGVVALVATNDGKASLVVGVTEDLTDRLDAVGLVRAGAAAVGGKGGGGRPDMAQAGGPEAGKAAEALAAIEAAMAAA